MKKINVDTLKSTTITETLPEIKKSVDSTIEDDSKGVLDTTFNQLQNCNTSLKKTIKQLNSYMNSMAEAFEAMDKNISITIEESTSSAVNTASTKPSKGTEKYLAAI
jgi:type VII secretion effector (TIGR04197 family)